MKLLWIAISLHFTHDVPDLPLLSWLVVTANFDCSVNKPSDNSTFDWHWVVAIKGEKSARVCWFSVHSSVQLNFLTCFEQYVHERHLPFIFAFHCECYSWMLLMLLMIIRWSNNTASSELFMTEVTSSTNRRQIHCGAWISSKAFFSTTCSWTYLLHLEALAISLPPHQVACNGPHRGNTQIPSTLNRIAAVSQSFQLSFLFSFPMCHLLSIVLHKCWLLHAWSARMLVTREFTSKLMTISSPESVTLSFHQIFLYQFQPNISNQPCW